MFARRLISRKACRAARSENASRPLVLVYRERCVRLYVIFIALEIMESELPFYDDNFCKFHVLYACTGDACALETRRRFVTERGRKKKKKKRKPKLQPRPHCLGKKAKGVKKNVIKGISHQDYLDVLNESKVLHHQMKTIRSDCHQISSYQINKISLSPFDDKRYILSDGISSYAYGNLNITQLDQ